MSPISEERAISNPEASLLGLLNEQSMHAYEIDRNVVERDMRHWTELSRSSIYKLLRKLEERGLCTSESTITKENRVQKVYNITEDGRNALHSWVKEEISEWTKAIRPIDIALANLRVLTKEEVEEGFATYMVSLDKMVTCYTELEEYLRGDCHPNYAQLAARPLHMVKAEKVWLEGFLKEYRELDL